MKNKIIKEQKEWIEDYPIYLTDIKTFKHNYKIIPTIMQRIKNFFGIDNKNYFCWGVTRWGVGYLFLINESEEKIKYLGKRRYFPI